MKRNQVAYLYIICLCFTTILSLYIPQIEGARASEEAIVIPEEAIRLRILANSDSEEDQTVKRQIRDQVNASITNWVADLTSLEEAREVLKNRVPEIQRIAEEYVQERGLQQEVKVEFGAANFPTKLYGQFLYPAGEYEAIVISLGEGRGANWWCVLFPPLCFLDFSNGTAVSMSPMENEDAAEPVDEEETSISEPELNQEYEMETSHSQEREVSPSVYVQHDEEQQVIEKRWFFVDFFKEMF